ncbi:MAG TPA: chalcone isomerase family protein [Burkholderiales bacterium]|nr:chalcone isomerase family protein [Burkholderiales bacterium]
MRSFIRTLLAAALLSASIAQAAVQVGGVDFQPELGAQKGMLALNGAGLRTRVGFKVYAMGLYLRAPLTDAAAIIGDKGEKRIRIVLTRDLEAKQFGDALLTGLEKNHEPDELAALKPATDALIGALAAVGEVASGTEILLDQLANGATRLVVNGQQQGHDIADVKFYPALLRIWLGVRPADHDLRDALLRQSK